MKIVTTLVVSAGLMFSVSLAQAASHHLKTNILVQASTTLPDLAQQRSEDILLHYDSAGTPYLYVEQQQGARLLVLNVDDSAHIKVVASFATGISRPYDFVQQLGETIEQIRFRDGSGSALLNMRAAKSPQIVNVENTVDEPVNPLGDSAYLAVSIPSAQQRTNIAGRDYRVIKLGTAAHPAVTTVATIAGVTRIVERPNTGTTFVLGAQGLTVIRNLDTEQQYATEEAILDQN